jgi:membrane-bound lytic murein transglycosylase D
MSSLIINNIRWWVALLIILIPSGFSQAEWLYPNSLKSDVAFWKKVFTEYNRQQYIVHDSENLGIIYKVVTFDSTCRESQRERQLEKIKNEIKRTLLHMAKESKDSLQEETHLEKYILSQFGQDVHPVILEFAANQIRVQQGMREHFVAGLARALAYLPFMKEAFRQAGLPEELAYLPHIESSFHPLARSKVGAAGMWQFMRSTARLYMKVNQYVDERYDPLIATQAAARLLRYNYEQLGDWGLAITAYNFGLNGMKKAVAIHGPDYLKVRESFNHRKFKFASRNFYPEFLAVLEIMEDYQIYFPDVHPFVLPLTIRYQLKTAVKWPQLSKVLGLEPAELSKLNPAYSNKVTKGRSPVPAGYWVYLPVGSDLAKLELDLAGKKSPTPDTDDKLAARSPSFILSDSRSVVTTPKKTKRSLNNPASALSYRKPDVTPDKSAFAGQLPLWSEDWLTKSPPSSKITEMLKQDLRHKLMLVDDHIQVFANETLGHFSDWLRIPVSHLQDLNRLGRRKTIYQGQKLILDFKRVSRDEFLSKRLNYHLEILNRFLERKEFVNYFEYRIDAGESVWEIARNRYQVPLEIIQYFNINTDINRLYPGDVLRIPIFQTNKSLEETL